MSVAYRCLKGGYFWERGVHYGGAHIVSKKRFYSGGMGIFWDGRISKRRGGPIF